jgi:hypothetical protein
VSGLHAGIERFNPCLVFILQAGDKLLYERGGDGFRKMAWTSSGVASACYWARSACARRSSSRKQAVPKRQKKFSTACSESERRRSVSQRKYGEAWSRSNVLALCGRVVAQEQPSVRLTWDVEGKRVEQVIPLPTPAVMTQIGSMSTKGDPATAGDCKDFNCRQWKA